MPIGSTRAFVLGGNAFGEQDRLIHLLTVDQGIIKAIAPGSMKIRNRFGSLFELFTEGEFHYYWQENREMITISKGEIINSHFKTVSDAGNIFYFYLMVDVFLKFIPQNHLEKRLYRLLNVILEQRAAGIEMDLLLLYFLIWVLRIEGMLFNPGLCSNCGETQLDVAYFRTDYRGLLCRRCRTTEPVEISAAELNFVKWTERGKPSDLSPWKDKLDRARMIRAFTRKIQHHGECTLNSAQYLSEFA